MRRKGRHADMVLLVRRCRNTVDTCGMRKCLVFRRERGGGDLHHHEAAVQAALFHEERRQAAHVLVDEQGNPALRQRADLGDRERQVVGGERDRLGVEIAAREHGA